MTSLKHIHDSYLADEERQVAVNRELEASLKDNIMSKRKVWIWTVPAFVGVVAVLAIMLVVRNPVYPLDNDLTFDGEFISYDMRNFACEGDACDDMRLIESGKAVTGQACPTCTEVKIWSNWNSDKKTIMLAGFAIIDGVQHNLETQRITADAYPDWTDRVFELDVEGVTFGVHLRDTDEWNLVEDIVCINGCDAGMRVGTYGRVIIDTCPTEPCPLIEISHDGIADNGYAVRVYQRNSIFAESGEVTTLIDLWYSMDEILAADGRIHFEEYVLGNLVSFDLVAGDDDADAVAYKGGTEALETDVQLLSNGVALRGIEGSYCTLELCVDKSMNFKGVDFEEVTGATFTLKTKKAISEVSFGLMNENGVRLRCAVQSEKISDTEYRVTACSPGRHIIDVGIWYQEGGDTSYYYPLDMRCEEDCQE